MAMCASDDLWDGIYKAELRNRMTSFGGSETLLGPAEKVLSGRQNVWVLIFNQGQMDEGVYTLQGRHTPASSYVLAFDQTDEACRFAQLLQAEGFDMPAPIQWRAEQIRQFCESGCFELGIVPTGALLTPPAHNEYDADAFDKLHQEVEGEDTSDEGAFTSDDIEAERKRLDRLFDI